MKKIMWLAILGLVIAVPSWLAAQEGGVNYDHASVGIFADYLRFSPGARTTNFIGFGARAGFHVSHHVSLEGEMNYDFERNYTTLCNNNCASTTFVRTRLRPLTGLFGPKFETPGPFKFFVTGKVGFINFTTSSAAVTPGTVGTAITGVGGGGTHFAMYPGAGFEGFWGPFGLRLEAGDEVYLNNGTFNNLRVTFGPQIRF